MNVSYKDINTEDAAKLLGVSRSTIRHWCHKGYLCYQDVSEGGSKNPRFKITEAEITRIKKLIKKYGKRGWEKHALEGRDETILPIPEYRCETPDEEEFEVIENEAVEEVEEVEETTEEVKTVPVIKYEDSFPKFEEQIPKFEEQTPEFEEQTPKFEEQDTKYDVDEEDIPTRPIFDEDKVLDKLIRIKDLKERLSNLEAERNQINYELKALRSDILELI